MRDLLRQLRLWKMQQRLDQMQQRLQSQEKHSLSVETPPRPPPARVPTGARFPNAVELPPLPKPPALEPEPEAPVTSLAQPETSSANNPPFPLLSLGQQPPLEISIPADIYAQSYYNRNRVDIATSPNLTGSQPEPAVTLASTPEPRPAPSVQTPAMDSLSLQKLSRAPAHTLAPNSTPSRSQFEAIAQPQTQAEPITLFSTNQQPVTTVTPPSAISNTVSVPYVDNKTNRIDRPVSLNKSQQSPDPPTPAQEEFNRVEAEKSKLRRELVSLGEVNESYEREIKMLETQITQKTEEIRNTKNQEDSSLYPAVKEIEQLRSLYEAKTEAYRLNSQKRSKALERYLEISSSYK
jgi:hypothetical protein